MVNWRELGRTDGTEAGHVAWQVFGGILLLLMLGNWVHRDRPRRNTSIHVKVASELYRIDPILTVARIPIVIKADDNVILSGCPAAPVLVLQLWAGQQWNVHRQYNKPCPVSKADSVLRVYDDDSTRLSIDIAMPGRYRVGLGSGHYGKPEFIPGDEFTVR